MPALLSGVLVRDERGRPLGTRSVLVDVTAIRAARASSSAASSSASEAWIAREL